MPGLFFFLFFSQLAFADCAGDFAKAAPLRITYQAPLLLAAPPPAEVSAISEIADYLRRSGRAALAKKVSRWISREESEVGEALLLAARHGRWDELTRALEKTGLNLRRDLFALRSEISAEIAKEAKPFPYDFEIVRASRPGANRPPSTFRRSAQEVEGVLTRYPLLAKNISEKSEKIASLELRERVDALLEIPDMQNVDEAKIARLNDKEKKMMIAVWNRMNDPAAAARYVRELAEDAAVEMANAGSRRANDALARGELIRNDVLKVLVKRHKTRGNDKFSVITGMRSTKPSTATRKTSSNDDFREAVRQGPFFDKPFLGGRHGVDTHFLQIEYVDDAIWEASGGNPREFWEFLGSKRGINYWVTLFDSFNSKTLARPEFFAHQISDLLKITD